MAQLYQELDLHALQITECKRHFLEHTINVFGGADQINQEDLQPLHTKIGQVTQ